MAKRRYKPEETVRSCVKSSFRSRRKMRSARSARRTARRTGRLQNAPEPAMQCPVGCSRVLHTDLLPDERPSLSSLPPARRLFDCA